MRSAPILPGRHVTLNDAERELERVQEHELSFLLRQAAALKVERAPLAGATAPFPLARPSLRRWRRRSRAAIGAVGPHGPRSFGARILAEMVEHPIDAWPGAVRLARAARRVEDGELARICVGHTLLCEGNSDAARRVFALLLRNRQALRHRWRVLEGLALAHEAQGRMRLALGAIEAAADEPSCGISALVSGLHLAFVVGDTERARRAAARLDLLADPFSPEFSAAVAFLRKRVGAFRGGMPWKPENVTRSLFHQLVRDGSSAAGRVCRALT